MLPKSNDIQLTQSQHIDGKYVFFYQRWREMLESRTLDMYQYNILNTYVACSELSEVIEKTLAGLFTSRQNIDDCKEEALLIVKSDEILKTHNRPLKLSLIRILATKIEGKSREDSGDNKNGSFYISLKRLKYQLQAPLRQLEQNYLSYTIDSLKESIDISDNKKIDSCMTVLISQCIFKGWSSRGLFKLSDFFEGSDDENEKWSKFKERILSSSTRSYEVFYRIKIEALPGQTAESIRSVIRMIGIQLAVGSVIIGENKDKPNLCSKISPHNTYLIIRVNSPDVIAGVLSAINIFNSKLSIVSFYNLISPWIANSPEIIVYDSLSQSAKNLKLPDIFKTYDYIDTQNTIFEDTIQIFDDEKKSEIANKIGAAFAYTSLGRSSLFQETKYISLWIALESLMRTGQYNDIISHIKLVLPEVMCTRYIYRVVRNFTEDCKRCDVYFSDTLSIDILSVNKKSLVTKMIDAFRDNAKFIIIQQSCNCNSLLLYRCNDIHSLLNSTDEIVKRLDHYTQKIRWHIQRLYRIRNEITHSAFKQNKSLVIYIEHLYSYLSQAISEIVFYIESQNAGSVEDALATIKESYLTYLDLLKQGGMQIEDVLPNGIISLT